MYTFRLARWLQTHGHAVEVVCVESIDAGEPSQLHATRDMYQNIPVWRLSFNLFDAPERLSWNYDNPLLGNWFENYLCGEQPDLVHFQAGYLLGVAPLEATVAAGIPSVLTLHDYWYLCPRITLQRGDGSLCAEIPDNPAGCVACIHSEQRRFRIVDQLTGGVASRVAQVIFANERNVMLHRRKRLLPALALPDAVITPSRFLADRFASFIPQDRLHISRYGLDLVPFEKRDNLTPDGVLRIGFVGQIAPHKGVHLLVDAFRTLQPHQRPIELHLYGGLDARPDYVQQLKGMVGADTHIFFHGRFENSHVAAILSGLDVTVVPSVWYENSPLAIMEAHAAGIPVVTAALGGMAELVRNGIDGLHFRPANRADLACTLQRLLDEPHLLPHLKNGVKQPRSIEDEMQQVMQVYEQVMAPRGRMLEEVR